MTLEAEIGVGLKGHECLTTAPHWAPAKRLYGVRWAPERRAIYVSRLLVIM
jgi:hypothetical protein